MHENIKDLLEIYILVCKLEYNDSCEDHLKYEIEPKIVKGKQVKHDKNALRNQASALEGRIRDKLEQAEILWHYNEHDELIRQILQSDDVA